MYIYHSFILCTHTYIYVCVSQYVYIYMYMYTYIAYRPVGQLRHDDICVVPVDRAECKSYAQCICVNAVPTLTCHNSYLVLLGVADIVDKVPDSQRQFFRKVHDCERLHLRYVSKNMQLIATCVVVLFGVTCHMEIFVMYVYIYEYIYIYT